MVGEKRIDESLEAFFSSRGHRRISGENKHTERKKGELVFTDGVNTIYLRALEMNGLDERNRLLETIADSVAQTSVANKVYLALPKVCATILDAAILREKGLGLMVYDSRGVEEVLPARLFDHMPPEPKNTLELEQLRGRISTLEQIVEALNSELSKIRLTRPVQLNTKSTQISDADTTEPQKPDVLPSFLQDNPWVDILARRGREVEQVAS